MDLTPKRNRSGEDGGGARLTDSSAAGVPLELVQWVTAHLSTAVVLKHYFPPGRENFRAVITQAMPKMLGIGDSKPTAKEEMKRILERSTNRTWSEDRKRMLELIKAL